MSIIIKGMDMPETYLRNVIIAPDGKILYEDEEGITYGLRKGTATQLPDPKVFAARMELAKCYYPKDTIAETLRGRLDPEMSHISADRLMCELLETLGYGEAVKIFEEIEKWYS